MTDDRSSLDASEPRELEEPTCPLCGTRIAHPYEPGGTVLCHPDRGGCGAHVRPVPYLARARSGESSSEPPAGPARTTWEGCCAPYAPAVPSGRNGLRHSSRCDRYRNELLTEGELKGYLAERRSRDGRPTLGTANIGAVMIPIREDEDYIDAHIDDEDDA